MRMERVFRRWLAIFILIFALFNLLPLLAPTFMQAGWSAAGNAIYDLYGVISHQFAHRSFFFYGEQVMYTPDELPLEFTGERLEDARLLKRYRGDETHGWKMAWSDRLVAMFGSWWISAMVYGLLSLRRKPNAIPLWLALLLIAPLVLDGITHTVSDAETLFAGFRYENSWLASLTRNAFSQEFYAGDALGSFNSWVRILSGILFGIGFVGYTFPHVDRYFSRNADILAQKLQQWRNKRNHSQTID